MPGLLRESNAPADTSTRKADDLLVAGFGRGRTGRCSWSPSCRTASGSTTSLLVVLRSALVPLKAVVMHLLSIGAAHGVILALCQWGWLGDLTMHDEAFLLSRVREEQHRTGDSHTSVADGLAATAKVITVAAAIMVVVFGASS